MVGTSLLAGIISCLVIAVTGLTPAEVEIFRYVGKVTFTVVSLDGLDHYQIESNGLPDHGTPDIEGNPNSASEQSHNYTIPKVPILAPTPGCLPMGAIGMATNGVALFNPFTADGHDAVKGEHREVFDDCSGHAQQQGTYHYHKIPNCIFDNDTDQLLGVALDGYGIYGPIDENGLTLVSSDLDECHGRMNNAGEYRYHMTEDFPYILGCFMGQVNYTLLRPQGPSPGGDRPPPGGDRPPPGGDGPPPGGDRPPPGDMGNCVFAKAEDLETTDGGHYVTACVLPVLFVALISLLVYVQ